MGGVFLYGRYRQAGGGIKSADDPARGSAADENDVAEICTEAGKVTGIKTSTGEFVAADHVICNADPPTVYRQMLPSQAGRRKKVLPEAVTRYSMGLFVLFFGTSKQYPDVAHHTIWMGKRYKELLNDIFNKKILAEDFSLYLHRPTATDASFAPEGCDSFYVLCPVPNLQGMWTGSRKAGIAGCIIKALEASIMPGLSEAVVEDFYMTPEDFRLITDLNMAPDFRFHPALPSLTWFRYHNRDPHLDNLYFFRSGRASRCRYARGVVFSQGC